MCLYKIVISGCPDKRYQLSDDGEDVDYSGYAFNSDDEEVQLIEVG